MDRKTYSALQASIRHWEENVAAEHADDVSVLGSSCALCRSFEDPICIGCPVWAVTGEDQCKKTPWWNAREALRDWIWSKRSRDDFRAAALEELNFLRALVPAGGPEE